MILKMEDNIIVTKIRKIKRILCSLHFLPPSMVGPFAFPPGIRIPLRAAQAH